ncbi:MAG: hypothetical protein V2A65_11440 [Candidatus Omnitrophota bacterium]
MKKLKIRELTIEVISLLIVFSAGFLVAHKVAGRTGSVWLGILAGSLTFLGIFYGLTQLVNRTCHPARRNPLSNPSAEPSGTAAPLNAGEAVGFLLLFLVGYLTGHFVAGRSGSVWWGVLAGSLTLIVIFVALIRLYLRIQAGPSTSAPSSPSSPDQELAWAEPRAFRSADLEDSKKWVFNMVLLIAGVALIFICIANRFGAGAEVTRKLLITAGGLIAYFFVLLGYTRLMSIIVKITDKAVVREMGDSPAVYQFGTIDHCEIGRMMVKNQIYSILVVALKQGDRELFCVHPSISTDVLRSTLEHRGVNVVIRTDMLSEEALKSEDGDPLVIQQRAGNRP